VVLAVVVVMVMAVVTLVVTFVVVMAFVVVVTFMVCHRLNQANCRPITCHRFCHRLTYIRTVIACGNQGAAACDDEEDLH